MFWNLTKMKSCNIIQAFQFIGFRLCLHWLSLHFFYLKSVASGKLGGWNRCPQWTPLDLFWNDGKIWGWGWKQVMKCKCNFIEATLFHGINLNVLVFCRTSTEWDVKLALEYKDLQRKIVSSCLTSCHAGLKTVEFALCDCMKEDIRG